MTMPRVSYGTRTGMYDYQDMGARNSQSTINKGPYKTLEDLTKALKADIDAGTQSSVPECTTSELSLDLAAWVPLHRPHIGPYADGGQHDLPPLFKTSWTSPDPNLKRSYPQASISAIISLTDSQQRQIVQRAASRGIVAAIEAIDGFKYSFNNAWAAKDEDGQRFSYICQDSMQNKDRHANGFTRTQKHLKGEGERGVRKPTYDCKGSVSVKCSLNRGCVDVYYRHYAIHPTLSERRAVHKYPQPQSQSHEHRREMFDTSMRPTMPPPDEPVNDGGLFGRLQESKSAFSAPPKVPAPPAVNRPEASNIGRPLKRKRDSDAPIRPQDPRKPLSLVELLKQSQPAKSASIPSTTTANKASHLPPPVNYDLPSWEKPPPKPPPPIQTKFPNRPPQNAPQYTSPYQPPYQPTQSAPQYAPASNQRPQQRAQIMVQPVSHQQYVQPQPPPPLPQHPPQQKQEYFGLPKPHAQSQGLFTTMKPVVQDPPIAGYVPVGSIRAKSSCTHCRYGKKKCDEVRPICSACSRAGKYDCIYEGGDGGAGGGAYQYVQPMQAWSGQPPPQHMAPMVPMPSGAPPPQPHMMATQSVPQRQESPDPWFPKR